jgi:hypothetical protein
VDGFALPELAIASMGLTDLLLILLIVVVLFGATRLARQNDPGDGASTTSRWTRADLILLIAAIVSVSVALALPALRRL